MHWVAFVHLSNITLSWLVKLAMIQQIRLNYERRGVTGQSLILLVANFMSYGDRNLSGVVDHNFAEIVGAGSGHSLGDGCALPGSRL
jgi:hypothetical protein